MVPKGSGTKMHKCLVGKGKEENFYIQILAFLFHLDKLQSLEL